MKNQMDSSRGAGYRSACQIARKITEGWACENLYCVACESDRLVPTPCNAKARDFVCEKCAACYQLKSLRAWSDTRVPDAGYDAMLEALRSDSVPNLFVLGYTGHWQVSRLLLIPSFFFSTSSIQKRRPLGSTARRAGWVGCNILLSKIPSDGKIPLICNGEPRSNDEVRRRYAAVRPLAELRARTRGWTLDVLQVVRGLGHRQFVLDEVYAHEHELRLAHPGNQNVRPKIRQQLQVLRDLGLVEFGGWGRYLLKGGDTN